MNNEYIFSWAENALGQLVHVDSVPRGKACGCHCPSCGEPLVARHGQIKEHGFAHSSKTRRANLRICYMVTLYKLAEQIILRNKRIHAPAYYGIFPESDITFDEVEVDSRYERIDKQPDVIASTSDDKQYLIEFVFYYKVQHKQAIDYKNLTCLEIDLSNQSLESLEEFLMASKNDRRWQNNQVYFNRIEETYRSHGKAVRVVAESDCEHCDIKSKCCAVQVYCNPLIVENSGVRYRLCKTGLFEERSEQHRQEREQAEKQEREMAEYKEQLRTQREARRAEREARYNTDEVSCFTCEYNLRWANKENRAACGIYRAAQLPSQYIAPDHAKTCRCYKRIATKRE